MTDPNDTATTALDNHPGIVTTLENVVSKVDQHQTALDTVSTKVDQLTSGHAESESRLTSLEEKLGELWQKSVDAAGTGVLGDTAKEGVNVVQSIVDFLHHVFPASSAGIAAPGIPTIALTPKVEEHS